MVLKQKETESLSVLIIDEETFNSLPALYQALAKLLEREGKVRINNDPAVRNG